MRIIRFFEAGDRALLSCENESAHAYSNRRIRPWDETGRASMKQKILSRVGCRCPLYPVIGSTSRRIRCWARWRSSTDRSQPRWRRAGSALGGGRTSGSKWGRRIKGRRFSAACRFRTPTEPGMLPKPRRKRPPFLSHSAAPNRFCQCDHANQRIPAASATPMIASNWWKYFPRLRQFSPSFIPKQANAKHHGQEPRNV